MHTTACFALTVAATYYITSFFQAYLHRNLGHRSFWGPIYRTHTMSHHSIYSGTKLITDKYSSDEESLTFTYLVPSAMLALLAYVALPLMLFAACVGTGTLSFLAHVYFHTQYHLKGTWLRRFDWFERKRRFHLAHHDDPSRNFAVLESLWDRVMGTYSNVHPMK